MDIYSKPGTKVLFTAQGGYEVEREDAKNKLVLGREYTVKRIDMYSYTSRVVFEEVEGRFNTSLFEKVD